MIPSMEFGACDTLDGIDFQFREPRFFYPTTKKDHTELYIGAPIWGHKDMIARLESSGGQTPLQIYAQSMNAIELNSTYYSLPKDDVARSWIEQTPSDFRFFVKAPQDLSFRAYEAPPQHIFKPYLKLLALLGDRCGESFLQFPPHLGPADKRSLFHLLESLPSHEFSFAIELRHPKWFEDQDLLERLCEYLKKRNIGLVQTDTPGRRDVLSFHLTVPRIFVRYKGSLNDSYDQSRLKQWSDFFHNQAYFDQIAFFHHHSDETYCIDTIDFFSQEMSAFGPKEIKHKKEIQSSLFD